MKRTIGEIEDFIRGGYEISIKAKKLCIELLEDEKEFPTHSIEYDWENDDTPSISSGQFDDDLVDAYITRLYLDKGLLKVDLHAYYIGEDRKGIDLRDECGVDYLDILDYINHRRTENDSPKEVHRIIETSYGEVMLKPANNDYLEVFNGDNFDNYIGGISGKLDDFENVLVKRVEKLLSM